MTPDDKAEPPIAPIMIDIDGCALELRIFADPSGLRGQVFSGEEKLAGIQIFHTRDVDRLIARARADRAVLRAVAARNEPAR